MYKLRVITFVPSQIPHYERMIIWKKLFSLWSQNRGKSDTHKTLTPLLCVSVCVLLIAEMLWSVLTMRETTVLIAPHLDQSMRKKFTWTCHNLCKFGLRKTQIAQCTIYVSFIWIQSPVTKLTQMDGWTGWMATNSLSVCHTFMTGNTMTSPFILNDHFLASIPCCSSWGCRRRGQAWKFIHASHPWHVPGWVDRQHSRASHLSW